MQSDTTNRPPVVPKPAKRCFLVLCRDGAGSAELRREHLEGHLDHVERNWTRYVTAGPIREPGGEALVGSVFLVLAESLEDARELMNGGPYITCGMYAEVEYKEFSNAIGLYLGGRIWHSAAAIAHRAAGGAAAGSDTDGA